MSSIQSTAEVHGQGQGEQLSGPADTRQGGAALLMQMLAASYGLVQGYSLSGATQLGRDASARSESDADVAYEIPLPQILLL
jgi:hypothetical protein